MIKPKSNPENHYQESISHTRDEFEKSFREQTYYARQTADDGHLKRLLSLVNPDKGEAILDMGTGGGYLAFAIAGNEPHCNVTGMDILPDTLQRNTQEAMEQGYANITFIQYDGTSYPLKDHSFNTIVTRYVLHHIPNLQDSFNEMYRVLKPGGKLVISDPTPNQRDAGFVDQFMQQKPDAHIQFYTLTEYKSMLEAAGFHFVSNQDSVIRFPRKNPEAYKILLSQYSQEILDGYEIKITQDEIWIKERVLNMVFRKE